MSKVLLHVRVGKGNNLVRVGLFRALQLPMCWYGLHVMLVKGESSGFSLSLRGVVIPKAHPKPSPSIFRICCCVSEIGLWLISSECVSVFRCLQQELFL